MVAIIEINGAPTTVLETGSSGPGEPPHTYRCRGFYVYELAGEWLLQRPGQYPVTVKVSR